MPINSRYRSQPYAALTARAHAKDLPNGFSLMEMLVVLVILGLLFGLVGPRVLGYLGSAKTKSAALQIENLKTAIELFAIDVGRFSSEAEGLRALTERPNGLSDWRGPYLQEQAPPKDPWGGDYHYSIDISNNSFEIRSFGADNVRGGDGDAADIVN